MQLFLCCYFYDDCLIRKKKSRRTLRHFHHEIENGSSRNIKLGQMLEPIPSTGCGNRKSPVTNLPTRSSYEQVTVTR